MKKVTEERACDRCSAKIEKDCGVWIGSELSLIGREGSYETIGRIEENYDLCIGCTKHFEAWVERGPQ